MRKRMHAWDVATTVRVSEATRARAAALASERDRSIGQIVEEALDALEAAEFWRKTREALAAHPQALEVDPAWDGTLRDDLDRE